MKSSFQLFLLIFPVIFGVITLSFFALGLRGILTKKPFLISSRWLFGVLLLGWAPMILQPFLMPKPSSLDGLYATFSLIPWLQSAMFLVLLIFTWVALQGYIGYGITDTSIRDGLIYALDKLKIPFEENINGIYLPSIGANLRVAVQSWIGVAQINIRPRRLNNVLRDVTEGMSHYYQTTNASVNLITCYFYLIMGTFMLVFTVLFVGFFSHLRPV